MHYSNQIILKSSTFLHLGAAPAPGKVNHLSPQWRISSLSTPTRVYKIAYLIQEASGKLINRVLVVPLSQVLLLREKLVNPDAAWGETAEPAGQNPLLPYYTLTLGGGTQYN